VTEARVNKRIALIVVAALISLCAVFFYVSQSKPVVGSARAVVLMPNSTAKPVKSVDQSPRAQVQKYLPVKLAHIKPPAAPIKPKATYDKPAQLVREVQAEADAGSASAMYMMETALRRCATADMRSDQEIEALAVKRSLGQDALDRDAGRTIDEATETQRATDSARLIESVRDECKQLPAEQIASWKTLLERSAQSGDPEARTAYAHAISDEFKDRQHLLENYDEFKRQNDLANSYLQDSVANGDCSDVVLNGFRWVTSDPTSTYVYQSLLLKSALRWYGTHPVMDQRLLDAETASLNASLKNLAMKIPADQIENADAAANYILQNICQPRD
jgi:hypothetical protein